MELSKRYKPSDKLKDLISDNSRLLMVLNRFGISLGFGEKTVKEGCESHGVDVATFLAVANFIGKGDRQEKEISMPSLISYLKQAHVYFLDYVLPMIRRRLIEAIDCSGSDEVAFLILRFYDEYVVEVRRHMEYENRKVFKYVEALLRGEKDPHYTINTFSEKHNNMDAKLKELKDIIIRYYPEQGNDLLTSVLFDIINCEEDLLQHCEVEDYIFVPAVRNIEDSGGLKAVDEEGESAGENAQGDDPQLVLSQREREIVGCVACGMSNKQIADKLFLSIHTVTTHRRNISNKLQIHTPSGLTIYAIVHKLVKLQDIKIK
ncbi:MAG: LuxR C-terminal-related transcriptional regulator [Muribaculaceae bacterium]